MGAHIREWLRKYNDLIKYEAENACLRRQFIRERYCLLLWLECDGTAEGSIWYDVARDNEEK